MSNLFEGIFKGRVVIVGIGNVLRGDDAFGPKLIEQLSEQIDMVCIDAGSAPENYIGKIAKERPNTILIVDVVDLGQGPGDFKLLNKEQIVTSGFTTHDLSPRMFIDFLAQETKAAIYLLGVQPKNIDFGSEMSDEIVEALRVISNLIKETDQCMKLTS